MTKKEINDGNQIIVNFMKLEGFDDGKYGYLYKNPIKQKGSCFSLEYDSSWDWIMTVVDKIEGIIEHKIKISNVIDVSWWYSTKKYTTFKQGSDTSSTWREPRTPFGSIGGKFYSLYVGYPLTTREKYKAETKIQAVYIACIEFIKWYNKTVLKTK